MPQFAYTAKSAPGQHVTGFIQAQSQAEAVEKIIKSGQVPVEVALFEQKEAVFSVGEDIKIKVPAKALLFFVRQLADLLDAGVPLMRSMTLLAKTIQYQQMANTIGLMRMYIEGGGSLSQAMSQHKTVFAPVMVNMVRAGELSGQLPLVLGRLADFLEKDLDMRSKIKASLMYPIIVLCIGVVTIGVMLTFVLPRMTALFDDMGATLPWPTQIVIGLSHFFVYTWWVFIIIGVFLYFTMRRWLKTRRGKLKWHKVILKIPVLKDFLIQAYLSRLSRTLATLISSGVPLPQALESTVDVIENDYIKNELREIILKVKNGVSFSQAIKDSTFFPEIAVDMIAVGQETGKLEKGLVKLAQGCERMVAETSVTFINLLGPLVLVGVIAIVGFMVISMLLPMFSMNMLVQ